MSEKIEKTNDKEKNLEQAIQLIEKTFGKGAIMRLGDDYVGEIDVIPTGSVALDNALGIGGFPRGRISEVYGPESSGKTTICLHAIAEAQRMGGIAAFVDAEHAIDPNYAAALGVKLQDLYIVQPDDGEQAIDIVEALVRSGSLDIIVVDSVAALTPRAEIEGDMATNPVGMQARMMSRALRKLTAIIDKTKTCVIFINQLREKVGVMFGNPETTPGGKALKFYCSVRLDIRKKDPIKNGTEVVGNRTTVKVVKNKFAPPLKVAEFDLIYGKGVSNEGSIVDLCIDNGILKKSGSWISYNDEKLGQGRDKVVAMLREDEALRNELLDKVQAILKGQGAQSVQEE